MATVYTRGMAEWSGFTTNTFKVLLLKGAGYTPNVDHDYVADVTPGSNEVAVTGYARQTLGTKTSTYDDTNNRWVLDCANPNFGTLTGGPETVTGMVVYREVTNDADSVLVAYYPLTSVDTDELDPFVISINEAGLLFARQAV